MNRKERKVIMQGSQRATVHRFNFANFAVTLRTLRLIKILNNLLHFTMMNFPLSRTILILILFLNIPIFIKGADSLKYSVSLNYYSDLSDTYGVSGNLFSGEFVASRSWYGISMNFGHYLSQSTFIFKIVIEETNETFNVPVEEMAIMKLGSLSGFLRPIHKEWIDVDILFGAAFGKARHSMLKNVDYTYNLVEHRMTSLTRDYMLIKKNHFGYQAGLNISFYPTKKVGIQINARLQDLSNGGTFFLVGGGLSFKL